MKSPAEMLAGMRARLAWLLVAWLPCALVQAQSAPPAPPVRPIEASQLRSGLEFAGAEARRLAADDFLNPGMLWVDRGMQAWAALPAGGAPACQGCHGDVTASMKGVSVRYPRVDPSSGRLRDLTGAINACVTGRQKQPALAHESEAMLALTALVGLQSRGLPMSAVIDGPAAPFFEAGRRLYQTRLGQMNLACTHCHDRNWGRRLLNETISQGQPNAYPIYRLEWQTMGSLHRRFRSCLFGVRAELLPQGADEFVALELYLAWRASGLPVETPGVRR